MLEYQITNIVAQSSLGYSVDLYKLAGDKIADYEPEMFPGAKLIVQGKRILVFPNGKLILAGMKDDTMIRNILKEIDTILRKYKKHSEVE